MSGNDVPAAVARSFALHLLAAAILPAMGARAAEAPVVDTSSWVCKYCPFEETFVLAPNLGIGYVSEDSAKFGEYTGLNEQGAYVVADADGRYRGKDGLWLDLSAVDLGLDSRYIGIEGGRQGKYEVHLSYKELPHNISDTTASPFIGSGTAALTLPAGWVPGATTSDMSALDTSLGGVEFETERRLYDLGASLTPVRHWAFAVNVRHEEKTGRRDTGGSFVFNDSRFAAPVDYRTDQFDASAAYNIARFQARIAYYASIFRNDDRALTWGNPYVPLLNGGTTGQLALAPDNEFHQLVLSAGYRVTERTQLTADVAFGRMTQDEAFLPYTVNTGLVTQPLPRSSLDGRVDTLTGNLRLTSTLSDKLRINASLAYNDRDNRTPRSTYDWVLTDTAPAEPRTNLPYSFERSVAKADGAYSLTSDVRLYAGCSFDEYRRDLQEVARTREGSCWGKLGVQHAAANVTLMYTHAERTGSDYVPNPDDTPQQNPLMRIYYMADRDRDAANLRVDFSAGSRFEFGLDGNVTWDSYYSSVVGLLDGRSWAAAADCAWTFSEKVSATCYFSHEQIKSRQANAELLAPAPLWYGENVDTIDTAGAGLRYIVSDKLDLGLDYTYSRSTGDTLISSATVGFPDLKTRLSSARLYVNFKPKKRLSLRLSYWYEDYESDDWAVDGVTPATISNVLTLGQQSPAYNVNVVSLSTRYEF